MRIILLLFIFIFAPAPMYGRSGGTSPMLHIFQQITVCLSMEYLQKGEALPASFEEISLVSKLAGRHPEYVKNLNNLSIVPGAPVVQVAPGVTNSRAGCRLFCIARSSDLELENSGRLVVLITKDGSSALTNWIPEPEAQIILKQLKGFDPAKQPLAFQDLVQSVAEKAPRQKSSNLNDEPVKGDQHPLSQAELSDKRTSKKPSDFQSFWVVGGIIFLLTVGGYLLYQRRSKELDN